MKNFDINLQIKSWFGRLRGRSALLFYIIVLLILIFEAQLLYNTGRQVWLSRQSPENVPIAQGIRFNFAEYDTVVKRIEAGKSFYPALPIWESENPFD